MNENNNSNMESTTPPVVPMAPTQPQTPTPVAPVPVAPIEPVSPVAPVATGTPVMPTAPGVAPSPVPSVAPAQPQTPSPVIPTPPVANMGAIPTQNTVPPKKNNKLWLVIIVVAVVAAIAMVVVALWMNQSPEKDKEEPTVEPQAEKVNRTILIYMVGSDLEHSGGYASNELGYIKPENIDLENNNIILMAGGSKTWKNDYIAADESSVYRLTPSGFQKVKQQEVKNMGAAQTLQTFLTQTYTEYPAEYYDLIFWDHGSGIQGLESDKIYGDNISLAELEEALKGSPFSKEKLDSVLFINCLLGGLEVASVMDDYANYMVASEEVSLAAATIDKFKFLEEIEISDRGYEFGKKFIDHLNTTPIDMYARYQNAPTTYSILDLSKIKEVETTLDAFADKLSVNRDYYTIARTRANIFQYGATEPAFDSVDLYTLVFQLQALAPTEADKVLTAIKEAVKYNYALEEDSKGLSIFFPYNGGEVIDRNLEALSNLPSRKDSTFTAFLKQFDLYRKTNSTYNMDLSKNTVSVANNDYSMKLSASQKESFANASYMIFQKNGNDYSLIYQSDDTTLDNNGKLKANFDGKIMMYSNSKNKTKRPIFVEQKSKNVYNANIVVKDSINHSAVATIETSSNKGSIVNVVGKSDDDRELLPSMTILKLEDYSELTFETNKYRLLDNSGYFAKDWESTATAQSYQTTPSDYQLVLQNVPKGKGYYFAFEVRDISNEITYTKPVEIK